MFFLKGNCTSPSLLHLGRPVYKLSGFVVVDSNEEAMRQAIDLFGLIF